MRRSRCVTPQYPTGRPKGRKGTAAGKSNCRQLQKKSLLNHECSVLAIDSDRAQLVDRAVERVQASLLVLARDGYQVQYVFSGIDSGWQCITAVRTKSWKITG